MNKVIEQLILEIEKLEEQLKDSQQAHAEIKGQLKAYRIALDYMTKRQAERRALKLDENEGMK